MGTPTIHNNTERISPLPQKEGPRPVAFRGGPSDSGMQQGDGILKRPNASAVPLRTHSRTSLSGM